jgi:hypothetical protein
VAQVEEIAKGAEGWSFQEEEADKARAVAQAAAAKPAGLDALFAAAGAVSAPPPVMEVKQAKGPEAGRPEDVFEGLSGRELRGLLHKAAKREEQLEGMLTGVRRA